MIVTLLLCKRLRWSVEVFLAMSFIVLGIDARQN